LTLNILSIGTVSDDQCHKMIRPKNYLHTFLIRNTRSRYVDFSEIFKHLEQFRTF
jgi:hypothetical protein